ncbi:MAG TPA: hypothetical protein VF701_11590 [Thermoanaerobaculia bacterium]
MNTKRKAELQRKLSMSSVPTPPAGLAERIKRDIPLHLKTGGTRRRFSFAGSQVLKIAAMLAVVIGTLIATRQLFVPMDDPPFAGSIEKPRPADLREQAADTTVERVARPQLTTSDEAEHLTDEELATLSRLALQSSARTAPTIAAPAATASESDAFAQEIVQPQRVVAEFARETQKTAVSAESSNLAAGVEGSGSAGRVADAAPASDRAFSVPQASPAPMPAPPPPPSARNERITATASSPAVSPGAKRHVTHALFGVSTDPGAFPAARLQPKNEVRQTIDVEGIVNHFAGRSVATDGVQLETEGSRAVAGPSTGPAILRVTAETAPASVDAAAAARLTIDINASVVKSFRAIGGASGGRVAHQSPLPSGVSVTRLFMVELQPGVESSARVATVRLEFDSRDGSLQTIERLVHARDLATDWGATSARHRRTTLAGAWAETLRARTIDARLSERARALRDSRSKDSLAAELADAIELSMGRAGEN